LVFASLKTGVARMRLRRADHDLPDLFRTGSRGPAIGRRTRVGDRRTARSPAGS
jgi:hypothetical protein